MKAHNKHFTECEATGKKSFPSLLHAETRALFIKSELPLYGYKCPKCDAWHLTKQPDFQTILEINLLGDK